MTNPGRHRDEATAAAERYGKHSQAHADLPVVDVLRRVAESGEAIRLAWQDDDSNRVVEDRQEFPTAVLPVIRDDPGADDETTEPTTATREARQWFGTERFPWWPKALAG